MKIMLVVLFCSSGRWCDYVPSYVIKTESEQACQALVESYKNTKQVAYCVPEVSRK